MAFNLADVESDIHRLAWHLTPPQSDLSQDEINLAIVEILQKMQLHIRALNEWSKAVSKEAACR